MFFSGLTVLLGLLGLVLFEFMILRSVGIAGAIVVFLAVASAVTLLPALLAIVGTRIDTLSIRRTTPSDEPDGRWSRLARWVMRRPVAVLIPTLGLLLLLGWPFLHVRFNAPDSTILPASVPSRAAFDRLAETFGEGEFAPLTLAIRTDGPATSPENLAALYEYSRRLAADPRVTRVEGLVDVDERLGLDQYQLLYGDPNGPRDRFIAMALAATTKDDLTTFTVFTPFGPNRAEGRELVAALRDEAGPLAPPAGVEVLVGGGAADVADVVDRVAADFPRTALFIVTTTYIVLFLLLRSAVLPIKALVMNTLSIVASFGALVWIFQDGNLSSALGFQPLGFVETTQPVILFCVLFGLSMDYEVFLLSRMKEVWDQTHDNTEAVARGLERSGRIVTSAALIVVVVAGSFAFADIVLIKALGIGMAIAVALDATVVRALLVPATMRLLGKWNWWAPEWARRVPAVGTAVLLLRARPRRLHRPDPRRAAGRPPDDAAGAGRGLAPAGPDPDRAAARRRGPRPPDRVVVLHGPPPGRRRPAVRLRVRDLPRRARRAAGVVGVAPGADRRVRRRVPLRPADADRWPRRRVAGRGLRPGARRRPTGRRPGAMAGVGRRRTCSTPRQRVPEMPGRIAVRARRSSSPRRSRPRCTTTTAGSTSGRPAARTTTRGRRWTRAGR